MMALGDVGFFLFHLKKKIIPPSSKQSGHFVLFLQLTGSLDYLVLPAISVQLCGL